MATTIAHEVNQPLIAIQNYAHAARRRIETDADDRPKLLELFTKIEGQAQRAGAIIERIRSAIGTGGSQLQRVSLCTLFEEAIRMMQQEVNNRGCKIACESESDLPAVMADGLEIQLVLVNLLQNAMKAVCSGGPYDRLIRVDVRAISGREVQASVKDRGPGVPPALVPDLFERLSSEADGGMGIGLAVAKAIIDAHDGRLWYEPNPAGGAIFRFTLKMAA